jgi:ABC-type uncharacterized transport system permease subunit
MERWLLVMATLLAGIGGGMGMHAVWRGRRSRWTTVWMAAAFLGQFAFLYLRGQQRGACPLRELGEVLVFLAWSLTMFYLIVGHTYRVSLLGVFTAPVVVVFQCAAMVPGLLTPNPPRCTGVSPWLEGHAAMSVLSYGALALAAVAGVMFLVLDRQLKEQSLASGLFRNLPPASYLLVSLTRLLRIGVLLLTFGLGSGAMTMHAGSTGVPHHLVVAVGTWVGYLVLLGVQHVRGLAGRRAAWSAVLLFVASLTVFLFV